MWMSTTMLDMEDSVWYLGYMLGAGSDSAIPVRCDVAWGKLRKLLPVLTTRHLSPRIHGKVCEVCVRSAMLHGGETLGPMDRELRQLHRNDCAMNRWICGIKNRDETPTASLLQKHRGHYIGPLLQQATPCIKSIANFALLGIRKKGRPRKTWSECMKTNVDRCDVAGIDLLERDAWKTGVQYSLVLPTP